MLSRWFGRLGNDIRVAGALVATQYDSQAQPPASTYRWGTRRWRLGVVGCRFPMDHDGDLCDAGYRPPAFQIIGITFICYVLMIYQPFGIIRWLLRALRGQNGFAGFFVCFWSKYLWFWVEIQNSTELVFSVDLRLTSSSLDTSSTSSCVRV